MEYLEAKEWFIFDNIYPYLSSWRQLLKGELLLLFRLNEKDKNVVMSYIRLLFFFFLSCTLFILLIKSYITVGASSHVFSFKKIIICCNNVKYCDMFFCHIDFVAISKFVTTK